jgi:PST family polysaccharide transporter/lipopolysaccharide exporter
MRDKITKLFQKLVPTGSVLQRTVKSAIWSMLTNVSGRLLQVLMLVILARLLTPGQFGLMGIALVTLSASKRFTNIGLDAALIQKEDQNVDSYLNTTWLLEIGRGLLILSVVFLTAPVIADIFDEPRATNIIRAIGFVPALKGFQNPATVYFKKNLALHRDFLYNTGASIGQFVVGVIYAWFSPTVWALVAGSLSRPILQTALSYLLHDYRPWPSFDFEAAKELIDFGKWVTGSSIMYWIARDGDDAFVGWLLSATALGFYQYAYQIADMPATELSQTVSGVTFPAYSRVQENSTELQNALLQSTRFIAFLVFPMSFGIALIAPSFVPVVLGPQWTPMIVTMQLLAIFGLCHGITGNYGEIWKTLNRPDLMVKTAAVRVFLMALFIWPATARWGIEGTALVVAGVYAFPVVPLHIHVTARLTELSPFALYREYLYPFVASLTMFGTLWYLRPYLDFSPLIELVVFIPAGVVIYSVIVVVMERQFDWGIRQNIQLIVRGIRG